MTVVSTIYNEVLKEFGGIFPTKTSRIIPPPIAVLKANTNIPKISIRLDIPTKAPEIAKAIVPAISKKVHKKIKINYSFYNFSIAVIIFLAILCITDTTTLLPACLYNLVLLKLDGKI